MRTTINLDDELIEQARRLTGVQERTASAGSSRRHRPDGEGAYPATLGMILVVRHA